MRPLWPRRDAWVYEAITQTCRHSLQVPLPGRVHLTALGQQYRRVEQHDVVVFDRPLCRSRRGEQFDNGRDQRRGQPVSDEIARRLDQASLTGGIRVSVEVGIVDGGQCLLQQRVPVGFAGALSGGLGKRAF